METFFLNKMRRERCELPKAKENDRETNTRIYTGSARPKPTSSPQQSIEIFIIWVVLHNRLQVYNLSSSVLASSS